MNNSILTGINIKDVDSEFYKSIMTAVHPAALKKIRNVRWRKPKMQHLEPSI